MDMIQSLPACVLRCGLFPSNNSWSVDQSRALQNYVLVVNAVATHAYDAFRRGIAFDHGNYRDLSGRSYSQGEDVIFQLAVPPLRKRKHPGDDAAHLVESTQSSHGASLELPGPMTSQPASDDGSLVIFTDGSFSLAVSDDGLDKCGWGFCVAPVQTGLVIDMCGPVDISGPLSALHVTDSLSNNVAELCAILHALLWTSHRRHLSQVILASDSAYAINTISRVWRPRTNLPLIIACRSVLDSVQRSTRIVWRKVSSHTGIELNDRADHLAKNGASGVRHYTQDATCLAP